MQVDKKSWDKYSVKKYKTSIIKFKGVGPFPINLGFLSVD